MAGILTNLVNSSDVLLSFTGVVTLFVVNHRKDKVETIEVFQFDQQTLTLNHKKSLSDPELMRRFVLKNYLVS